MTPEQELQALEKELAQLTSGGNSVHHQAAELKDHGMMGLEQSQDRASVDDLEKLQTEAEALEKEWSALNQAENKSYSLMDRLDQMIKGVSSGAYHSGMNQGLADPWVNADPALLLQKQALKQEQQGERAQEQEYLKGLDSTGRILHHTGEWVESGASTPVSPTALVKSLASVPGFAKILTKALTKEGAIGAGSGVLQEEGLNPVVSDLVASLVGRNVKLPSAQRGAEKSVRTMVGNAAQKNLKEGESPLSVNAVLDTLKKKMGEEQAGEALRKALLERIQGYDEAAKDVLYKNHPEIRKDLYLRDRIERGGGIEKVWGETDSAGDVIREDRTLGKMLEPGQDSRTYALGNAEIPELFLNKSMESVENARQLMKVVGTHPQAKKALEGYVQHHVLSHIMDEAGKVDVKKLTEWKKTYPSYGVLYPKIEKKLNNLYTAQMFANSVMHEAKNMPIMEMASLVPRQTVKSVIKGGSTLPGKIYELTEHLLTRHYQDLKAGKTEKLLKEVMGDQELLTLFATKPNQMWSKGELFKRLSGRDAARSVQGNQPSIEELIGQLGQYLTPAPTQ